ncbi:TonB-dependent receptor plug domain-containing protein [Deferrisoma palaeochoriense]
MERCTHRQRVGRSVRAVVGLALLPAFCSHPAPADESPVLQEVVVSAEVPPPEQPQTPERTAAVTVIPAERFQEKATSVPEVLEQSVGLTIRRFGGLGAFSTASIRGSTGQQVAVLLDGVPLAGPGTGLVNLGDLPLGDVERIEVYRGTSPLRLRSPAIGGVINVVTRRAKPGWTARADATYGSFDTLDARGVVSWKGDRVGLLASGSYTSSDGDFEFLDDNGTRANPDDDETTTRRNNAFYARNLLAKVSWEPSPLLRLELSDDYFDKREGVPGIGSNQSDTARLRTYRNVLSVRAVRDAFLSENLGAELFLHRVDETTAFLDPLGEIGVGRQDNVNETVAWGGEGILTWYWGEAQVLSFLGAYRNERAESRDELTEPSQGDTQERTTYQAGVEDEVYLLDDRLVLVPQVLYTFLDHEFGGRSPFSWKELPSPDDRGYWTYRVGLSSQPRPWIKVRANVARAYRFPTLTELFGDRGTVIGNPELVPERGVNWDVGVSLDPVWPGGRVHLEAAYFQSRTDDLILFEQTSQRTVRATNVSSAWVWGVETAWSLEVANRLAVSGNYTFQHTENTSDIPYYRGNQLPGRPEHELFNRLELLLPLGLKAFHEFSWTSGNYLDAANFERADIRRIHNLGLSARPTGTLTVTFEAKNLTDEQVSDALGFPLPGRSYYVTVSAQL